MDVLQRLKRAEALLITGGEGNVHLVAQDLKLLVNETIRELESVPGPDGPGGALSLQASLEADALAACLDGLVMASAQEQFAALDRIEAFARKWQPPIK